MFDDEFFLKLMFSDFGRGSYKTLFDEFEQAEPGYYKACLDTYKSMTEEITVENLNIEKIKKFHQMIVSEVKNTNYKNDQHLAANFSLDERKFMIPIYGMSPFFRRHIKNIYPFGVYIECEQKYYRKKISEAEIENYINKYLKVFKDQINLAKDNNQKEQAIYEFVQNLEFLHPFFDANIRFFGIALHNVLRRCVQLKEVVFVDPNSLDLMSYKTFKKVKPYFELNDTTSGFENGCEIGKNNISAIKLYEKINGFSHFFRMLVENNKNYSEQSIIKYLSLFSECNDDLKAVFLSKDLDSKTIGIHYAMKQGNLKIVGLWIYALLNSTLSAKEKFEVINFKNHHGQTLLDIAIKKKFSSIITQLEEGLKDLNLKIINNKEKIVMPFIEQSIFNDKINKTSCHQSLVLDYN
ncbi:hypothetical protein L3V86_04265 [Thiotrichales bacterium 19S11-10]|nr:hypothetical protein [Thiotrichales bacterium 19S11-10]